MNTIKSLLFILIMLLLCVSCNKMQVFRMDVLKPGFVLVPSQKNNIVLADNSGVQPQAVGHQVKVGFKVVGDTSFNLEPLSGMLLSSLSNYLLKEGCYDRIRILSRNDLLPGKTEESDYLRSGRISNSKIMEISRDTSVNLLFTLDRLLTKTTTNSYYTGETYTATRDVWINTVWRVYDLDMDTIVTQFQYNDSLYWQKFNSNPKVIMKMLPEMETVLPEIADVVAEHLNKFMGPHWETEKREYYCTGGYRMKLASDLVREELIDDAAKLWEVEFEKGFLRSKYRAAINMMFYEEVKGVPSLALSWEAKAEEALNKCPIGGSDFDIALLAQWKKELEDRVNDVQKLKIYFVGNLN